MVNTHVRALFARAAARRRRPRPFGEVLTRTLAPRLILFASLCAAMAVGNAMTVDPLASATGSSVAVAPTWTTQDAIAHPDCVPAAAWPQGKLADTVVAFGLGDDVTRRIGFDRAWALNHDASGADDVWVVGYCP
jgi:hypothetical protein